MRGWFVLLVCVGLARGTPLPAQQPASNLLIDDPVRLKQFITDESKLMSSVVEKDTLFQHAPDLTSAKQTPPTAPQGFPASISSGLLIDNPVALQRVIEEARIPLHSTPMEDDASLFETYADHVIQTTSSPPHLPSPTTSSSQVDSVRPPPPMSQELSSNALKTEILEDIPHRLAGFKLNNDDDNRPFSKDLELFESHASTLLVKETSNMTDMTSPGTASRRLNGLESDMGQLGPGQILDIYNALNINSNQQHDLEESITGRFDNTRYEYETSKKLFQLVSGEKDTDSDPLVNAMRVNRQMIGVEALKDFAPLLDVNMLPPLEPVGRALSQFQNVLPPNSKYITAGDYAKRMQEVMCGGDSDGARHAMSVADVMINSLHYLLTPGDDEYDNAADAIVTSCDYVRADLISRGYLSDSLIATMTEVAKPLIKTDPVCCAESTHCATVEWTEARTLVRGRLTILQGSEPTYDDETIDEYILAILPSSDLSFAVPGRCISACEFQIFTSLIVGHLGVNSAGQMGGQLVQFDPLKTACEFSVPQADDADFPEFALSFRSFLSFVKTLSLARSGVEWSSAAVNVVDGEVDGSTSRSSLDLGSLVRVMESPYALGASEDYVRSLFSAIARCGEDGGEAAAITKDAFDAYLSKLTRENDDEIQSVSNELHDRLMGMKGQMADEGVQAVVLNFGDFKKLMSQPMPLIHNLYSFDIPTLLGSDDLVIEQERYDTLMSSAAVFGDLSLGKGSLAMKQVPTFLSEIISSDLGGGVNPLTLVPFPVFKNAWTVAHKTVCY